ncbi:uncharacterized protein LOC130717553 [Lotus japonicus]|uniref:uncharacterized protein LOC130717553 n=1 Tax=Lotus japonicus TaxID=34305 RepID=UPI0025830841|nr:uncharacterized protein LOC130717553 [Lotus japonicus]
MATDAGSRGFTGRAGNESAPMAGWKAPPARVVKVNTNVSLSASGECGMGLVARDSRGRVLASVAAREFHSLTIAVTEGIVVKWAIRLALDLVFKDVIFETDNMQVVSAWSTFSSNFSYLASVVSDCVALFSSFSSFSLCHVRRGANKAADFMAKYALSGQCFVWIDDAPHALEGILSMDVAAISS